MQLERFYGKKNRRNMQLKTNKRVAGTLTLLLQVQHLIQGCRIYNFMHKV